MTSLRLIRTSDLDLICRHRHAMFYEAGRAEADLAAMANPFRSWVASKLASGEYFGFVKELQGSVVGGIGLMVIDWPPHPFHPMDERRGYVLNLYVEPEHRRRGIAQELMERSEQEFRRRGIVYVILHATAEGRPLYERSGWVATTEMAKALPQLMG
jgi:GNAT superfamily N-acetyltransferase